MHDTTVVKSKSKAYIILADVEFLHDGQAAHKHEHAAELQQHAKPPSERIPPMVNLKNKEKFSYEFI